MLELTSSFFPILGQERHFNSRIWRTNPRTEAAKTWIEAESESSGVAAWKHEAEVGASGNKPQTWNKHFEWESKSDHGYINLILSWNSIHFQAERLKE